MASPPLDVSMIGTKLQKLISENDLERSQRATNVGRSLLELFKKLLQDKESHPGQISKLLEDIEGCETALCVTPTTIAIVGNTGSGKSSIINSLLDEERIVLTSCMNACTSFITVISKNLQNDAYRAEIQYIDLEEWKRELENLFQDILDDSGVFKENALETPEARIAYAKIKAVYPWFTKSDLKKVSVDELMNLDHVRNLGKQHVIEHKDANVFIPQLRAFVETNEKSPGRVVKADAKEQAIALWPLIKVVRVFLTCKVLDSGAHIVDLPGVQDANLARAKVAEDYMKDCNALFLVAPITRAVDEKTASTMLSESFKRRCQMDGMLDSITFVCSMTDQISVKESGAPLGISSELAEIDEQLNELSSTVADADRKIATQKQVLHDAKSALEHINDMQDLWNATRDSIEECGVAFEPVTSRKRRSMRRSSESRRTRHQDGSGGSNLIESDTLDEDVDKTQAPQTPLTLEQVRNKLSALRTEKDEAKENLRAIKVGLSELENQKAEAEKKQLAIKQTRLVRCIAGRNRYTCKNIQDTFAMGVREMKEDYAYSSKNTGGAKGKAIEDYSRIADSLPVFCVSSRAYQQLCGNMKEESKVPGFETANDTQIPQLQAHCFDLAKEKALNNMNAYLLPLSQLLNSFTLWATQSSASTAISTEQQRRQEAILKDGTAMLRKAFLSIVEEKRKELDDHFMKTIYRTLHNVVDTSVQAAPDIVETWGIPSMEGGMRFNTFKAACRRGGKYSDRDLTQDLITNAERTLGPVWDNVFRSIVPDLLKNLAERCCEALQELTTKIESQNVDLPAHVKALALMKQQMMIYEKLIALAADDMHSTITTKQKEINRTSYRIIKEGMISGYQRCCEESGPGMWQRMKTIIMEHVQKMKRAMFTRTSTEIKQSLQSLTKEFNDTMIAKLQELSDKVERDFTTAVAQDSARQTTILRQAKASVCTVLLHVDGIFDDVPDPKKVKDIAEKLGVLTKPATKLEVDDEKKPIFAPAIDYTPSISLNQDAYRDLGLFSIKKEEVKDPPAG